MVGESRTKQSIRASLMSQNLIAAGIAFLVMMSLSLAVADSVALASARRSLAAEIEQPSSTDEFMGLARGRGSRIVLDFEGKPLTQVQSGKGQGQGERRIEMLSTGESWEGLDEVKDKGSAQGSGKLPWSLEDVVWAARVVTEAWGDERILVLWESASSVRSESWAIYAAGAFGIALSFVLNLAFSAFVAKRLSTSLSFVAAAGERMAEGDYEVSLPEQPSIEVDRISRSLNGLATGMRNATDKLSREAERLSKLEGAQRKFVADASHEIRAPLAAMAITLDAWKDGLLEEAEEQEALSRVRQEVRRLNELADELLDLSRIESGRERIVIEPTEVKQIINRLDNAFRPVLQGRLSISLSEELPRVQTDGKALLRILGNLLQNAGKFSGPQGRVYLVASIDGPYVKIEIRDEGPGIDPGELPRIWDRFTRAEKDRASGKEGSGLGLAIVKALADAMGAEVSLHSDGHTGTTATVKLKASPTDLSAR